MLWGRMVRQNSLARGELVDWLMDESAPHGTGSIWMVRPGFLSEYIGCIQNVHVRIFPHPDGAEKGIILVGTSVGDYTYGHVVMAKVCASYLEALVKAREYLLAPLQ